jgi:hypothetical protein
MSFREVRKVRARTVPAPHISSTPEDKFYETLFSDEVVVTSKAKSLIHDYIDDNCNSEPKAKRVKKSK